MAYYRLQVRIWIYGKHCIRCPQAPHPVKATCNHHVRGRVGTLLLDKRFWAPLCRTCHQWVHCNIALAREARLIALPGDWGRAPDDFQTAEIREVMRRLKAEIGRASQDRIEVLRACPAYQKSLV